MENMSLRILINKGSSINTTDKNSFERDAEKNINLEPSKTKIYPYASEPLVTKGHQVQVWNAIYNYRPKMVGC